MGEPGTEPYRANWGVAFFSVGLEREPGIAPAWSQSKANAERCFSFFFVFCPGRKVLLFLRPYNIMLQT